MAKKRKTTGSPSNNNEGSKELIVVAKRDAGLRARSEGVASAFDVDPSSLDELLKSRNVSLNPLFGESEEAILKDLRSGAPGIREEETNIHLYYQVEAPENQLDQLCEELLDNDLIDGAYVKPPGETPLAPESDENAEGAPMNGAPLDEAPPAIPGNYVGRQGYLNAAPGGIEARYAWGLRGGKGSRVRIIDLEWGWRFNHIDLRGNQGGVLSGSNSSALRSENHGTAVLGVYGGDHNSFGVAGISPDSWSAAVSFSQPTARAIRAATHRLRPGDIMLLEIHRAGPRFNYQGRADQRGYIAIEWWPDDYEAIKYATQRGVIVVSAAGNGAENLDDNLYDTKPRGFPSWWENPFNRRRLDSRSILVGAGAPPPGTHGRNHGPDRSRLGFSNYGAAIDAQGWGREVTTTGYGSLWSDPDDPNNRDRWFTDTFSGTSSASPIVVGAISCVQGYLLSNNRYPLSPRQVRQLLRSTGSPQQDAPGRPRTQRIGNRPNLRQMFRRLPRPRFTRLGHEIDQCSRTLYVRDRNNRWVRIRRGEWTSVFVAIDSNGYWRWRCGRTNERSRGSSSFRHRVKLLNIYHSTNSRQITWWCYDMR